MINSSKNAKQHANYLHHSTGRGPATPHMSTTSGFLEPGDVTGSTAPWVFPRRDTPATVSLAGEV